MTLSDIISGYVTLEKRGDIFLGLCPFHEDSQPFFIVDDEKNYFHCFGCRAYGDAVGFVMQMDGLTYPEAVEKLSRISPPSS